MKLINIQAAKTHLSRLVEEAVEGEEIVLAKAGKAMVRLVPYSPPGQPRTPGFLANEGWEASNCWDADEQILESSVSGPLFHGAVEEPPMEDSKK